VKSHAHTAGKLGQKPCVELGGPTAPSPTLWRTLEVGASPPLRAAQGCRPVPLPGHPWVLQVPLQFNRERWGEERSSSTLMGEEA